MAPAFLPWLSLPSPVRCPSSSVRTVCSFLQTDVPAAQLDLSQEENEPRVPELQDPQEKSAAQASYTGE